MDYRSLRLEQPTLPLHFSQDGREACTGSHLCRQRLPKDVINIMLDCSETAHLLGSRRGGEISSCRFLLEIKFLEYQESQRKSGNVITSDKSQGLHRHNPTYFRNNLMLNAVNAM